MAGESAAARRAVRARENFDDWATEGARRRQDLAAIRRTIELLGAPLGYHGDAVVVGALRELESEQVKLCEAADTQERTWRERLTKAQRAARGVLQ